MMRYQRDKKLLHKLKPESSVASSAQLEVPAPGRGDSPVLGRAGAGAVLLPLVLGVLLACDGVRACEFLLLDICHVSVLPFQSLM